MNHNTGSLELIKRINRQLVLEKIKEKQPISRARIARELSLSKTTVSAICDELLACRMVVDLGEKGPEKGSGRPSKMLGFNPRSACGVGIDLHPEQAMAVVTDLNGEMLYKQAVPALSRPEPIAALAKDSIRKAGMALEQTIALGLSVPGTVTRQGVVIRANSMGWHDCDLRGEVQPELPFPVVVNNEANCAALGERWRGNGAKADHLYYIAIDEGVGSAIISEGALIYGAVGRSGEIGYLIGGDDVAEGRRNVLGRRGVFEEKIHDLLRGDGRSPEALMEAYVHGEAWARVIVDEFVQVLSLVVANLISVLNPEIVVIGGGGVQWMEPVLPAIRAVVSSLTPVTATVTLGALGPWAAAIGAVSDALSRVTY